MSSAGILDSSGGGDPRMRGFKSRSSVDEIWNWIAATIKPLESEEVPLASAAGRVLAREIVADVAVPPFDRAAMDGYAGRAEETFGATSYMPAAFRLVARSRPGQRCDANVGPGETIEVATGAPLPRGADAVVPVELTQIDRDRMLVSEPIPQGRNVSRRGEDVTLGTCLLPSGRVLRPQDLGLLSAFGASAIQVVMRQRVTVLVTGDELLAPGTKARDFLIPDVNSVMIATLVARDGVPAKSTDPWPMTGP